MRITTDISCSKRRPTQAVILAGGRGTRMLPLTETRPKPMVEVNGRPFLEYQVEQLRDQGFDRILLLLGYLPNVIQNHFGNGKKWGVKIDYSITAPDDLTVHRMREALPQIDPIFLLLYCDNYWPMQFDRLWAQYQESQALGLITVYDNADQYSRDSVIVNSEGFVTVFDRTRQTPGLRGVEISYAILDKSVLDLLPKDDELFEQAIYPELASRGRLVAHVSSHRYYSVGSIARLPLTEEFLRGRPTVILDRDGVLNVKPPRAHYVRNWSEFQWLPGAKESLVRLRNAGFRVIVVSNQAGIGRGVMSVGDLQDIHRRIQSEVVRAGGMIDAFFYCPHDWDEGCECRKPRPGMLFEAQKLFNFDLTRTPFIGDDERDGLAASSAGCPFYMVDGSNSLKNLTDEFISGIEKGKEWIRESAFC